MLALLLAIYALASLSPFDWRLPGRVANGAVLLAQGWTFPSAGIVIAEPPIQGLEAAVRAESLEVSLEARPDLTLQSGPARILTISADPYRRNLTLAQDGNALVVRLRSQDTDRNGMQDGEPVARLEDVFEAGRWVAVDLDLRPGRLTLAIDGVPRLAAALPAAVLATWDLDYGLALGNEMTCDRPWLGAVRKATIAGPSGAAHDALTGQVDVPAGCLSMRHPPKLVPLAHLERQDALLNVLMYLPLGCLLAMMVRSRDRRSFAALVVIVAGVSLSFEVAQLFLPSRFPSIDDVIFNTLGGSFGIWLGFRLMRHLAPMLPDR